MNKVLVWPLFKEPFLRCLCVMNLVLGSVYIGLHYNKARLNQQLSALHATQHERHLQQEFLSHFQQQNLMDPLSVNALKRKIKRLAKKHTLMLKTKRVKITENLIQLTLQATFWTEEDWFAWLEKIQELPGVLGLTHLSIRRLPDQTAWPFQGETELLCRVV